MLRCSDVEILMLKRLSWVFATDQALKRGSTKHRHINLQYFHHCFGREDLDGSRICLWHLMKLLSPFPYLSRREEFLITSCSTRVSVVSASFFYLSQIIIRYNVTCVRLRLENFDDCSTQTWTTLRGPLSLPRPQLPCSVLLPPCLNHH